MMLNQCIVTGCAGFIGSSLVDRLLADGHCVTGIDNFSTGQRRFLEGALRNPGFKLIEGDLLDRGVAPGLGAAGEQAQHGQDDLGLRGDVLTAHRLA